MPDAGNGWAAFQVVPDGDVATRPSYAPNVSDQAATASPVGRTARVAIEGFTPAGSWTDVAHPPLKRRTQSSGPVAPVWIQWTIPSPVGLMAAAVYGPVTLPV